ncbi:hypothetical protein [Exiguobacterium sp.]|uniref:hypothetical protein n=1 Tax=Exiguobacterium sp. TaxID=44751 RepID=UPI0028AB416E|nr:hypothetical protein [Exiguobacterium sp.]
MLLQLTKKSRTKKGIASGSYIFNASYTTDESVLFQGNCLHLQKEKRFIFNDYIIRVHELKNGKWKESYEKVINEQHDVKFITAGLIGKYEHAVVGYKSGSRNFLNSYLIGSTDGKTLKTIQKKKGLLMGNAKIVKGSLYYLNRSITLSKYSYKKK